MKPKLNYYLSTTDQMEAGGNLTALKGLNLVGTRRISSAPGNENLCQGNTLSCNFEKTFITASGISESAYAGFEFLFFLQARFSPAPDSL